MALRVIAYTSGAYPCGIADYHQRLEPHVPGLVQTMKLPTGRVLRDQPIALLRQRLGYRRLASAADAHDAVLLQLVNTWNGSRLGEYLLPTFARRLRRPFVVVMHEWPEPLGEDTGDTRSSAARRGANAVMRRVDFAGLPFDAWLEREFFPRVAYFFVHAEHLKARLLEAGVSSDRITCTLMPVYPATAEVTPGASVPLVPANRRIVLLFGFPHPRKRYDVAVRVLADLPADTVMMIVGSTEGDFRRRYVEELQQIAAETGTADRLIVTGEMPAEALPGMFARADVALAPAGYATGSASLGHLIAAGVPVVASDVPSVVALRDAGAGIMTFEAGSAAACAVALLKVLEDPSYRVELRNRSRRFSEVHTFATLGAAVGERLQQAARSPCG